jgi:glutamate---cysteine ligase / carboxylate-amine ligase
VLPQVNVLRLAVRLYSVAHAITEVGETEIFAGEKGLSMSGIQVTAEGSEQASTASELTFQSSSEATIGVELELQIIDRESRDLAPGAVRILKECESEGIPNVTAELMQSMIELKTGVCQNVREAHNELIVNLRRVRNIASSLGYEIAMGGTHPFHRAGGDIVFPAERYERIQERLSWLAYQRVVFGLHVHVGVPGGDMAMGVIGMLVQYLPHLLAVSANSPFWQGVDTGLSSTRVALYRLLPHAGVPRHFRDWKEFRSFYRVMRDCGAMHSTKDIYWDIRPCPQFGTIEFRICDMPDSLGATFALVALIRSFVISAQRLLEEKPALRRGDSRRHWIAIENKWLATRYGLEAMYIRTPSGKRSPLLQDLSDQITRLSPIARETGDYSFMAAVLPLDKFESGADRQRRLYRESGSWPALVDDMTTRLATELKNAHV